MKRRLANMKDLSISHTLGGAFSLMDCFPLPRAGLVTIGDGVEGKLTVPQKAPVCFIVRPLLVRTGHADGPKSIKTPVNNGILLRKHQTCKKGQVLNFLICLRYG